MKLETYATHALGKTEFTFVSEGKKGNFEMKICFEPIAKNFYNLAFGLWDETVEQIEDSVVLRNGDMDKILATVARVTMSFLEYNPEASVAASGRAAPGEQPLRTRKYQMGINKHLGELRTNYNIYGFKATRNDNDEIPGNWPYEWEGTWQNFKSGSNYDAFLINLK